MNCAGWRRHYLSNHSGRRAPGTFERTSRADACNSSNRGLSQGSRRPARVSAEALVRSGYYIKYSRICACKVSASGARGV